MKNTNNIARTDIPSVPPIEQPPEFNPVELWWKAHQQFQWSLEDFSVVFGWEFKTIRSWIYGQRPGRQARIRAASLLADFRQRGLK